MAVEYRLAIALVLRDLRGAAAVLARMDAPPIPRCRRSTRKPC